MRIDLQCRPQAAPEPQPASASNGVPGGLSVRGLLGEDQTVLSGAHVQVAALAAQASRLPEVREERVESLRQAISTGEYHPNSEKVASALMAHLVIRPLA